MLLLSACSLSIDLVTITPVEYPQPSDFQKLSIPIGASFATDALRSNNYYGQFSNYAVPYNLSDIDHSYALATAQPVFKNVEFVGTDTGVDKVEFRLTRLPQTVLVDNALTPDVTDELVAQWILLEKIETRLPRFRLSDMPAVRVAGELMKFQSRQNYAPTRLCFNYFARQ
jgi:hypothetical protein